MDEDRQIEGKNGILQAVVVIMIILMKRIVLIEMISITVLAMIIEVRMAMTIIL